MVLAATPVLAQDATTADATATPAGGDAIVVTGSRIRQPELESTVPVTNFGGDQIYKQSTPNLGEALNNLPALRSTYSQSNPDLGIGVAGLNLLDLRGLGIQRTLTLVNGRRHVASDIQATASAVDINTIPNALIERVDIVTGGNSAVYGSDAVAGVVNFILKEDYEGFSVRGGFGAPTNYGGGQNQFISGVAGKNFAEGRGNITVALEFTNQQRLFASEVPWRRQTDGFITVDADASGSDGIPDTVFGRDIRNGTIGRTTLIAFPQSSPNALCGGSTVPGGNGSTSPYNCNFIFTPEGELIRQTFDGRSSTAVYGGFIGGNGETGNEGRQVSVYPESQRYIANVMGHYEFSPAAEFFFEGKFARIESTGSNSGPAFNQGQGFTFLDDRSQIRLDNPFLSDQARTIITNELLASGLNNGLTSGGAFSAADLAAIADGSYRFAIARSFEDLGIRDEETTRETLRLVAGFRGDISENLSYEVYGNYGRTKQRINVLGNVNTQRLLLSLDAGVDPETGNVMCRSQFDPSAAYVSPDTDPDGGAASLAADIAACVPYNPFGLPNNEAARSYIVSNSGTYGKLEQINFAGYISGDTAKFFELPGGPVGFAVGVEYRREDAYFDADDEIEQGLTFANSLQTFDPDPQEVKEVFGEIQLPILGDRPFFEELSLSAAGRLSDYGGATGTVFAYNFGGRYSPIPDITFRANYGRAIRAPNYTETADPLGQNFAPGFQDPCNIDRIGNGGASRRANCEADLGGSISDASFDAFNDYTRGTYSLEIMSGSNADLTEETSDSLTIGAVFQPSFLPGLSLTVDYYNIEVNKVIASPTAQQIVNSCYDLPNRDNQFCSLFERFSGPGTGPDGERQGEILKGSLLQVPVNFAKREREGIDFDLSYSSRITPDVSINSRLYYTHVLKSSNYQDPTDPNYENRILSELGDPKNEAVFNIDLTVKDFTLGYGLHYIGPMLTSDYENYYSLNGEPARNSDIRDIREYPETVYHNVRLAMALNDLSPSHTAEIYVGVDNLFNTRPPLGLDALTEGSAIYDVWGRRMYAGFNVEF